MKEESGPVNETAEPKPKPPKRATRAIVKETETPAAMDAEVVLQAGRALAVRALDVARSVDPLASFVATEQHLGKLAAPTEVLRAALDFAIPSDWRTNDVAAWLDALSVEDRTRILALTASFWALGYAKGAVR